MTEMPAPEVRDAQRRLRFTRWGLSMGIAAAVAIVFITVMLYLPGTQTQAEATGAQGAAFLLAMIAGLPTSLVSAPVAENLDGFAAWAGIAAMPVVNGLMLGALADGVMAVVRPSR